ncbi:MAG: OmpA family protein, partial [Bacteroidales bacterium]|nr:OmpA family protein [Bacteroidales bacterium]
LRNKYYIEEIYNEEENLYYYYLGEVMDFMNAYWAFRECNAAVFMPSVVVRDNSEGAKRELFALKSVYSNSSSEYFQSGSLQFIPAGQIYFNQIALMLKNYPDKKLLIECHTNEMSTESLNRDLSVNRAQAIGQYLISKGVSRSQIVSRGFGQDRSAYDVIKGVKSLNIIEFYILDN